MQQSPRGLPLLSSPFLIYFRLPPSITTTIALLLREPFR